MQAMEKTYIDKLAWIELRDKKVLETLSKGKDTWYIPGGKRENGESDEAALVQQGLLPHHQTLGSTLSWLHNT
jgi:hypothetical protein